MWGDDVISLGSIDCAVSRAGKPALRFEFAPDRQPVCECLNNFVGVVGAIKRK